MTPFLYVVDIATGQVTDINLHQTTGDLDLDLPNVSLPSVNSDGSRIAILADGPDGSRNPEILLVVDGAGNEIVRVDGLDEFADVAFFDENVYIDGSGRWVAFGTYARTITSTLPGGGGTTYTVPGNVFSTFYEQAVYRLDTATGDIELAYLNERGSEPIDDGFVRGISDGGRYIAFASEATDLPNATGTCQYFIRDMLSTTNGGSQLVSVNEAGAPVSVAPDCRFHYGTTMSDDGSAAVYRDDNDFTYLWRRGAGATELTAITRHQDDMALSGDGAWLAPEGEDFARLNLASGAVSAVDVDNQFHQISDDGSVLLFYNDRLTPPVNQRGDYWVLRFADVPNDTTPPTWPGGTLTATQVSALSVELAWSAAVDDSSGIREYVVYRDDVEIARVTERTFTDFVPTPGEYAYRVEAVDNAANESTTGPVTLINLLTPPIEIAIEERIRVNDENTQVLTAVLVVVEETIKVLDTPATLPAITLLVEETIRVMDEPDVTVQTNGPTPPDPDLIVINLPDPLFPGGSFSASAGGFKPLSLVQAFLESDPVLVGETTADADGNVAFTITVPPDFPPGWHTLALVGVAPDDSPRRLTAPIFITAPATDADAVAIPGPSRSNPGLWVLLFTLLATGALRLRRSRHRISRS